MLILQPNAFCASGPQLPDLAVNILLAVGGAASGVAMDDCKSFMIL